MGSAPCVRTADQQPTNAGKRVIAPSALEGQARHRLIPASDSPTRVRFLFALRPRLVHRRRELKASVQYHLCVTKPALTIEALQRSAAEFADLEKAYGEPLLYGVTDGKAVGTYLEQKFRRYLAERYAFDEGNSAKGIDFPSLDVDTKTTSVRQPQSSCPFKSGRQKIFGLGYSLLVFVYEKSDDHDAKTGRLDIQHVIFVEAARTGDFQMTRGLREVVEKDGNVDDLMAFMFDKQLPVDEIEAKRLAKEILGNKPEQGYLTISNALQWRLQYSRVIDQAGSVSGVVRVR